MEQQLKDHITFMKNAGVEDFDIAIWVKGYNKAKESLYTEEQVRKAYEYGSNASLGISKTNLINHLKNERTNSN